MILLTMQLELLSAGYCTGHRRIAILTITAIKRSFPEIAGKRKMLITAQKKYFLRYDRNPVCNGSDDCINENPSLFISCNDGGKCHFSSPFLGAPPWKQAVFPPVIRCFAHMFFEKAGKSEFTAEFQPESNFLYRSIPV